LRLGGAAQAEACGYAVSARTNRRSDRSQFSRGPTTRNVRISSTTGEPTSGYFHTRFRPPGYTSTPRGAPSAVQYASTWYTSSVTSGEFARRFHLASTTVTG